MQQGRSYWSGRLIIAGSQVNIPISLFTVVDKTSNSLCQRSLCCEGSVNHKKVCSKCGKDLLAGEIGKGYVLNKEILPIDEQQLEAIKPQGTDTIQILGVLDTYPVEVDTDKKYWISVHETKDKKTKDVLVDTQSREAYQLLTYALGDKILIGSAIMRNKEYVVALTSVKGRLMLSCLYYQSQLKPVYETGYPTPNTENVKAVKQFITKLPTTRLDEFKDTYSENLMQLILGQQVQVRTIEEPQKVANAISMFI